MSNKKTTLRANATLTQSYTLFIAEALPFIPFKWGGQYARTDTSTDNRGGVSVTKRFNPSGGTERDVQLQDADGDVALSIIMKDIRGDRTKSTLMCGRYHVDNRLHPGKGVNRADNDAWESIVRTVFWVRTSRELTETSWEGEAEAMITIPGSGLRQFDVYRNLAKISDLDTAVFPTVALVDVDLAQGDQRDNLGATTNLDPIVIALSTLEVAGNVHVFINREGGNPAAWENTALTAWTAADGTAILALGDFAIALSTGEANRIRTNDRFATSQILITNTQWATDPPTCIDAVSQQSIYVGGQNGYVYGSFDNGRTFEILENGTATTENINAIMMSRQNHAVIWAVGANNAVLKSENGETFVSILGPSPTDALLDLYVADSGYVLVINDDGEVWQTSDGGNSWLQHNKLPSVPVSITAASFTSPDDGIYYLSLTDGTTSIVYMNVENGASGFWEIVENGSSFTTNQDIQAIVGIDASTAVAVGGDTVLVRSTVALIS